MRTVFVVILIVIAAGFLFVYARPQTQMELKSFSFDKNGVMPSRLSCDGGNLSPHLTISGVSAAAKSLALIVDDPDATRGGTFTHWIIWNIPAGTTDMLEGQYPQGAIQGRNDFGSSSYGGPCPPSGVTHSYHFKLYALDALLSLSTDSTVQDLEPEIEKHLIEKAELVGTYSRP
ncbi:MAG: PEBP family protein [Parcubacteria group bacterium LiPW_15]|nr:MAG: PEBP family protein [Parcubacteria group bacterium LiPW_15]